MRLSIVHDSAGEIIGIVAVPPNAPMAHLETNAGECLTELDAPEIDVEFDAQQISNRLKDLTENYRIETRGNVAALARKGT